MSELKVEVEYTIKTGRQVVEKKQVDFPDKLNAQLDAIKQQYNDLGSQVNTTFSFFQCWQNLKLVVLLFVSSLLISSTLQINQSGFCLWFKAYG